MEYMENTFKVCKETKSDIILRKAKEPKRGKAYQQAKSGPNIWRKRAQTQNKQSPNGVKLYRHGPHIPRGPPDKIWARTVSLRVDRPPWSTDPLQACLRPNLDKVLPTASPMSVACVFQKNCTEEWRFAQDRKACKEAQLHFISTIHLMTV